MSELDSSHGSAAGIPGPPEHPNLSRPPAPPTPVKRRRRRRVPWVVVIIVGLVGGTLFARRHSAGSSSKAINNLQVGQCLNLPPASEFTADNVKVVECSQPHNNEVYAVGTPTAAFADAPANSANPEVIRICRAEVSQGTLRILADTPGVSAGVLVSKDDAQRVVCTAATNMRSGSLLTAATS